ncbi:MAG: TPM domain-containing protein [Candidatus Peribacteraceae bacterium]|jgi:uncharacterized protein|nr:TPM domain-containing protein [Candidatus Peribacteraceae bacterium]|tara:strand:- start:12252 stop:13163 length:912 start_codon:yes stop_codon:yes gene_type:complete
MRLLLILTAFFIAPNVHAFAVPQPDAFVTDVAGILTADQERSLEIDLQNYRGETSNEIAILLVNTLNGEAIADVAVEVGREWGIGSKENDNGILLLIAIEDRKLFIATGYGLEGAVPDLAAKQIIDNEIVPEFKSGSYYGGITAGIAALKSQIGGEYKASVTSDTSMEFDGIPTLVWILFSIFGLFFFFIFYQFFIGVLITISPSRSWWEGGFLGGMFGLFFGGVAGMIILALIGITTDFLASTLYLKYKPFREFLKKQKKKMKNREGVWFIGGGRGGGGSSSGGGGGFSGGSFGGGGAGGSW